jgi:hypothetical protein
MSIQNDKIVESQKDQIRLGNWQTCLNCLHRDPSLTAATDTDVRCNRFNAKPPASVIAVGCFEWTEEIPF